jgi:CRISPR/Cas system-associated exonuclease Cas4 (RecB family)
LGDYTQITRELEEALIDLLVEMKRDEHKRDVPRSHEQVGRCAKCGFRKNCDQSLA